ncbi:MAG: hypothetical protein ACJ72N_22325 [Labedaea sp.]
MGRRAVVYLLLVGCALAACGSRPHGPDADPAVDWAEQVCARVETGAATLAQPPSVDLNDPQRARDGMVGYLERLSTALDSVASGLRGAGSPPVVDGQAAVDKAMATIGESKTAVDAARDRLRQAPVTDPASFQRAVADVGAGMAKLGDAQGPTKDLTANPALRKAFDQAPTCRRLDGAA